MRDKIQARDYAGIGKNWDSYGAAPTSEAAIATTQILSDAMYGPPDLCPVPDGGMQLEWLDTGPGGTYVEIEVGADGKLSMMIQHGGACRHLLEVTTPSQAALDAEKGE